MITKIIATKPFCCNQNEFIGSHEFCFGPCGAGDGWIGKCVVCQKEWEIDSSVIRKIERSWINQEVETNLISSNMRVGDLIDLLLKFERHIPIDSIQLKGTENIVYASTNSKGLQICD